MFEGYEYHRILVSYSSKQAFFTCKDSNFELSKGYVDEIFQTLLKATKEELSDASQYLKEITPPPMNTMPEKKSREHAFKKKSEGRMCHQK